MIGLYACHLRTIKSGREGGEGGKREQAREKEGRKGARERDSQ
jgi:hypothetical protein